MRRVREYLTQMQLPVSTSARSEVVAETAANISGISCHSQQLFQSLPTTSSHTVHILQAFDVRGVASDPPYFIKAYGVCVCACVCSDLLMSVPAAEGRCVFTMQHLKDRDVMFTVHTRLTVVLLYSCLDPKGSRVSSNGGFLHFNGWLLSTCSFWCHQRRHRGTTAPRGSLQTEKLQAGNE